MWDTNHLWWQLVFRYRAAFLKTLLKKRIWNNFYSLWKEYIMQYEEAKLSQVLLMERMNQAQELALMYWQSFYFQLCNYWYPYIWHHYNLTLLLQQYSVKTVLHYWNKCCILFTNLSTYVLQWMILFYFFFKYDIPKGEKKNQQKKQQEKHSYCFI